MGKGKFTSEFKKVGRKMRQNDSSDLKKKGNITGNTMKLLKALEDEHVNDNVEKPVKRMKKKPLVHNIESLRDDRKLQERLLREAFIQSIKSDGYLKRNGLLHI